MRRLRRCSLNTAGFTLVETAIVVGLMLGLMAIGLGVYRNAHRESFDTSARQRISHSLDVASGMLVADRKFSWAAYGGADQIAAGLSAAEPALEFRAVATTPPPATLNINNDPADFGPVGVAVDASGVLYVSTLSRAGRCWVGKNDPSGTSSIAQGKVDASGNCTVSGVVWIVPPGGSSNHAPIASNMTVTVTPDTPLSFTLPGVDPDSDPLVFSIDTSPTAGAVSGFNASTGTLTYTPAAGDVNSVYTLDWTVSDGTLAASARVTINVGSASNQPPSGSSVTCIPANLAYGASTTCTVTSNDPDGNIVNYEWSVPGVTVSCDGSPSCVFTSPIPQVVTVGVDVIDSFGARESVSTPVTFTASSPTVTLACSTASATINETVICSAVTSDANGPSDVTFNWTLVGSSSTCGATPTCAFTRATTGNVTVTATAIDPYSSAAPDAGLGLPTSDASDSGVVAFTALGPTPASIVCSPADPGYNADPVSFATPNVACTASGSVDPDGGTVTYTWALNPAPGADTYVYSCPSPSDTCSFVRKNPGDVVVTVTATDDEGSTSTSNRTITFSNDPPSISDISCVANPSDYNVNTTCTAAVSDPNNDTPTGSWTQPNGSPNTCATLAPCSFTRTTTGSVTTSAYATDPYGLSTARQTIVTFFNTAPSPTVNCAAASVMHGFDDVCTVAEGDPNGGPYTYVWSGAPAGSGCSGTAASCTVNSTTTNTYTISSTVTDPYSASGADSDVVTIIDADPSMTAIADCSSAAPTPGSDVRHDSTCTLKVTMFDPDRSNPDPLGNTADATADLTWSVIAGAATQSGPCDLSVATDGSTIASCAFTKASPGSATVQVTGSFSGVGASPKTVSVNLDAVWYNNPPSITGGDSSCAVRQGQNCSNSTSASDPDGDALTWTWNPPASPVSGCGSSWYACTRTWSSSNRASSYSTNTTLQVCDTEGACDTANMGWSWSSLPNTDSPSVSVTCSPSSIYTTGSSTCSASASDIDGIASWSWTGCSSSSSSCTFSSGSTGTFTVTATACDAYGPPGARCGSGSDTVTVSLPPNSGPPSLSFSCSPTSLNVGSSTSCSASASDPDGILQTWIGGGPGSCANNLASGGSNSCSGAESSATTDSISASTRDNYNGGGAGSLTASGSSSVTWSNPCTGLSSVTINVANVAGPIGSSFVAPMSGSASWDGAACGNPHGGQGHATGGSPGGVSSIDWTWWGSGSSFVSGNMAGGVMGTFNAGCSGGIGIPGFGSGSGSVWVSGVGSGSDSDGFQYVATNC